MKDLHFDRGPKAGEPCQQGLRARRTGKVATHLDDEGFGEAAGPLAAGGGTVDRETGHQRLQGLPLSRSSRRDRDKVRFRCRTCAAREATRVGTDLGLFRRGLQLVEKERESERSEKRRGGQTTSDHDAGRRRVQGVQGPLHRSLAGSNGRTHRSATIRSSDEMPYGSSGGGVKVMGK